MNRYSILTLVVLSASISMAQVKTASFKDGTEIEYEVLERTTDNARRGAVRLAFGTLGLNYQYVHPRKFEVNGGVGDGISLSGFISLATKDKEGDQTLTLSSVYTGANSTTNYVVRGEKIMKTTMVGLHVGFKKYFEIFWPNYGTAVYGGLGHFMTTHAKYFVKEKSSGKSNKIVKTSRRGIYGDLHLFPGYKTISYDPLTSLEVSTTSKKYAVSITWEGSHFSSNKGKKGAGLCTAFGMGMILGTGADAQYGEKFLYTFAIGVAF